MIYFIRNIHCGSIKVGYSANPEFRLSTFQTANPHPLELIGLMPGGITEERFLHEHLGDRFARLNGEWFVGSPEFLGYLDGLVNRSTNERFGFLLGPPISVKDENGCLRRIYKREASLDVGDWVQIIHNYVCSRNPCSDRIRHYTELAVRLHGPQIQGLLPILDR